MTKAGARLVEHEIGAVSSVGRAPARQAVSAFLSYLQRRNRAKGTLKRWKPDLLRFAQWTEDVGYSLAGEVTAEAIEFGFLAVWTEDFMERNGREPAPASVRAVLQALNAFYQFLDRFDFLRDAEGQLVRNPMTKIDPPQLKQKRNDWLRGEEDTRLLESAENEQEEIFLWLLRWSGMRVGEAIALDVSDVDLVSNTIHVPSSKTDSGIRSIPILPDLRDRLLTWLAFQESMGYARPSDPFLSTSRGTRMAAQHIEKVIHRVAARAEVRNGQVTPHTLRRTYGSYLLNKGLRLEVVSKLLGHANTSITEKAYSELLQETIREELLNALA